MPENEDINTSVYTRSFSPWHPEVGEIFASNKNDDTNEGWTNIIVEGEVLGYNPVISSKFVKQVKTEPLVSIKQIPEDDYEIRMGKLNSVKYPGVWFMISELPVPGDGARLYIGKEVDGMIVFRWSLLRPGISEEPGRVRIVNDDGYEYVRFGTDLTKNEYELDLSKLNDTDFETLLKKVEPDSGPVVVKFADGSVRQFWISSESFVTNATESAPQYAADPAPVSTSKEEEIRKNDSGNEKVRNQLTYGSNEEEIYLTVDEQAAYPGGMSMLMLWLSSNISYPKSAQQNGIQGRVIVKFVVEKDGSITQPKVLKSVDEDLDNEALRVINKMPKWIPGKINGVPVRSFYTLPLNFRL